MNTRIGLLTSTLFLSLSFISSLSSQVEALELKLQLLADQQTWGVFVKPGEFVQPSENLGTGSGQVTIVAPVDFSYDKLNCTAGTWVENARVNSPVEAPGKAYVSFGFEMDYPKIQLAAGSETLLFTFVAPDFEGQLALIDNDNDPFAKLPNSVYTNPGNDLQIVDFAVRGNLKTFAYAGNYHIEDEGIYNTTPVAGNGVARAQFVSNKKN